MNENLPETSSGKADPGKSEPRTHRKERTVPHRKNRRLRQLLLAYRESRDPEIRDLIFQESYHLAERYARRYAGRGVDYEDLRQEASLGLLKAIEGFDPSRGVEFQTYAVWFVEGWIRQYFRDKAWICKVPRSVKGMSLQIKRLYRELGRLPTRAEIAERCDIPEDRIDDALAAAQTWASVSFSQSRVSAEVSPLVAREMSYVDEELDAVEMRLSVQDAAARALEPPDMEIFRMYYFEELTQREIASRCGTHQMRVSRSLRKSAGKLGAELFGEDGPAAS